ncbi:hypothetical protein LTR56_007177 [Elasticomyces elasticus]|nr:hypothetical protein LTR22_014418 [Elasticomyces elasticus]KAK3649045.1 hypothetical protein LTR56_007177 [Elasticomyces elasticus]KAK4913238.1 hypothetical protein LTR49_018413 [Elasticomyces elasticus]KAK5752213.1 hypothetical protein LTS12_017710 [Elasticomyces elasticus]
MATSHSPSQSPPPQPTQNLTKRDVRRNRIMERLQTMIDSFTSNQHNHYRAQLQAVQVDMTLVLRADPHTNGSTPLSDSGEDIHEMVESMLATSSAAGDEASRRDYIALAGKRYAEFAREVNDELEKRDAELTALHTNYHSSIADLERLTQQKLHQAEEEHKALTQTIRQRLQTSLTKKRHQLLKDKEQLDIADSNALLLHPNHFSINNPGSPGGNGQTNRKTRHLRHRAASPSAGELGENGMRKKRKGVMNEDDGNESPAPSGFKQYLPPPPDALGGGRSPFKDAREKNSYTQFEAPAYSLERIFTDKELAMASATAQTATYRYFHQSQQDRERQQLAQALEKQQEAAISTAVPSVDGETLPDAPAGATTDGEPDLVHPTTETVGGSPPAAAPEMERAPSHQVLTRGHVKANPHAALADLAAAASLAGGAGLVRENPFAPVVPAFLGVVRSEKSGAPAPPGVGVGDVENDFALMRRSGGDTTASGLDFDDAGEAEDAATTAKEFRARLFDQALGVQTLLPPYRVPVLEAGPAMVGGQRVERPAYTGYAQMASATTYEQQVRLRQAVHTGFGGVTTGLGGAGGGGAMAAALGGRIGGEAMSRTTSAGGGSEVGDAAAGPARRGRGRVV